MNKTTEQRSSSSLANGQGVNWDLIRNVAFTRNGRVPDEVPSLVRHKRFLDGRYKDWGEVIEGIPDYKRDLLDMFVDGKRNFFKFNFVET